MRGKEALRKPDCAARLTEAMSNASQAVLSPLNVGELQLVPMDKDPGKSVCRRLYTNMISKVRVEIYIF